MQIVLDASGGRGAAPVRPRRLVPRMRRAVEAMSRLELQLRRSLQGAASRLRLLPFLRGGHPSQALRSQRRLRPLLGQVEEVSRGGGQEG